MWSTPPPTPASADHSKSLSKTADGPLPGVRKGKKEKRPRSRTSFCDALILDPSSLFLHPTRTRGGRGGEEVLQDGHEAKLLEDRRGAALLPRSRGLSEGRPKKGKESRLLEPLVKELPMEIRRRDDNLIQLQMERLRSLNPMKSREPEASEVEEAS